MTDYSDRATCVLFGDGGGAVLLEPAEEGEIGFIDAVNEIDGSGGVSLNLKGGGSLNPPTHETIDRKMHYIYQDGPAVYKFAVRKMAEATTKLLARNGVTGADLGCFIPHQANKRIITATADRLGMDPERVIINIEKYGNTSAGTIPLAMETAVEQGKLKKGDLVLLAAVGAGFTVGTVLLRWEIG
jgi:3-oxoacyl-[acyl-carrier-protein] synthase-3